MATYRSLTQIPLLVARATQLARRTGFEKSSTPEVGRLLRVLAGQYPFGVIAEIGTGCGVGAAWMVEALQPGVSFITIETDEERVTQTREVFAAYPDVRVLHGDWHTILNHGPFVMLFADGGQSKVHGPETLVHAMRIGGLVVLDDLTPEDQWPQEWLGQPDPVREFWLNDDRLQATEIAVTPTQAVILAVRVR